MWATPTSELRTAVASLYEEIERASDRAVGVLAGSIVETHLTKLLQQHLNDPARKVWKARSHSSGPFGPFSVKIDLALLVGLISEEAHRDLMNLKNIRNEFAHTLDVVGFEDASIQARCKNFTLVDKFVGEITPEELAEKIEEGRRLIEADDKAELLRRSMSGDRRMLVTGVSKELATARGRYLWTARVLSMWLGSYAQDHVPPQLGTAIL